MRCLEPVTQKVIELFICGLLLPSFESNTCVGSVYKPLRSQKLAFANDFEYSFRKWNIKT